MDLLVVKTKTSNHFGLIFFQGYSTSTRYTSKTGVVPILCIEWILAQAPFWWFGKIKLWKQTSLEDVINIGSWKKKSKTEMRKYGRHCLFGLFLKHIDRHSIQSKQTFRRNKGETESNESKETLWKSTEANISELGFNGIHWFHSYFLTCFNIL